MRIAMVSSECEPFAKTGGLADVVDALARALGQLGHEVDVYLPRYRGIEAPEPSELLELKIPTASGQVEVALLSGSARGYRLRLVDHPPSFDRPNYYVEDGADYPDNGFRFSLLGRTALEAMRAEARPADVIHAHDWEGAPALLLLRHRYADRGATAALGAPGTMLTCHNLAYHGWVPREQVYAQLDLPESVGPPAGVNLLFEGILVADIVGTVSPTFARESLSADYGSGMDAALRARGDRYVGILNGIDTELWNPATDPDIPANYSADDLLGKRVCRSALCAELGLDPNGPIFAMISRLDPQKGFDLLTAAAEQMVGDGARIAVLGTGDPALVYGLRTVADRHPDRVVVMERFDRALARRIYAGADCFLMPSRFEPCGQSQMISMRYGTIPVARMTGGLSDTIVDDDAAPDSGNGFSFHDPISAALADACRRAMAALADERRWREIQARAMSVDYSWRGPAREYVTAYRRAIALGS